MRQYFANVFAELLNQIKDESIREKTIDAWVLAAEQGGWTKGEDVEKMPFTLLTEVKGVNLIQHTIAVTKGAIGLAKAMIDTYNPTYLDLDFDVLISGGLLHDVGKLDETALVDGKYVKSLAGKCARHPISGAIIASKVGLSNNIVNTIACHAKEGEGAPQRVETILIHQADFATFNPLVYLQKGLLITN